ncbi:ribosomal RNA large subunit methyltransferase H [Bartonella quintana JK 12]|uniref:Ribosomal RNA large subunit methyltransferase H n=1 Tax=Bartonella quintana JK 68 TaxID=1134503 RepID=A0ABR4SQG0_BARQI|nr:ribosomal RNA large subunit methyltransferase H [Bartonella quintana BQ2-D70]ETS17500.1 ribosomal RNA large subunit methyltransferase H [Bartonella quintana JK 7]ETS18331.1 ribosomal RNA large subunit methyltransferase H [Bartonella quintana JK 12]KEC59487.1 ribosomal RNA large subunit methyltransferase H [Bartonella quintana JK 19]KEC62404.1 ribosomal RNA large subunit methyltransferase H [Bartonella quintana JK 63]KEC63737.1 ribosomal RNA large subunit methyltransferase H [Bartonella quin
MACQYIEGEGRGFIEFLSERCRLIVLDALGKSISSSAFAEKLEFYRDEGVRDVIIALGGPDTHKNI